MLKIDKSTKFDPLPGGGSKDHNSRAVASYLFCGE